MKDDSTITGCGSTTRQTTRLRTLGLFAVLNAVLLSLVMSADTGSSRYIAPSLWDNLLHNYWLFMETFLVFAFVFLFGAALTVTVPRIGYPSAVAWIACIPVLWYADRLSRLSLQEGLLSSGAIGQLIAFAPYVGDYTTAGTFVKILFGAVLLVTTDFALLLVSRRLAHRETSSTRTRFGLHKPSLLVAAATAAVAALMPALRSPTHVAAIYRAHPQQHALCMLGIIDWVMPPRNLIDDRHRDVLETKLRKLGTALDDLEQRYRQLRIDQPETRPPDIVLIMAESLRYDAIEMPHAPNLLDFRRHAIVATEHYSGGNATEYGMFALLTGLDPALMNRARHWPVAFVELMKQAGYFMAFFGSGPYGWMDTSDFVRPGDWDVYHDEEDVLPFYARDQGHVAHIEALLDRKREARGYDGPVCIFFCPYTTHWDYHFAPEDAVHTPFIEGDLWWPPNPNKDLRGLNNRYLNSVHALDRVIEPLLTSDHVVIVVGDHGEAMFDYGQQLVHANALSPAQTRTPMVFFIPGAKPRAIDTPTCHLDVLPTLIDVIGSAVNYPETLSGRSLLENGHDERRFFLRNGKNRASGLYAPYAKKNGELNMVQLSKLDLWDHTIGEVTVHDESGAFKQTFGGVKDAFLQDFDAWLHSTIVGESNPGDEGTGRDVSQSND